MLVVQIRLHIMIEGPYFLYYDNKNMDHKHFYKQLYAYI